VPTYSIEHYDIEITRRAVIFDTNVLVARFSPDDIHHDDAIVLLEDMLFECNYTQFLVPIAVVVETWGFLVGSRKNLESGFDLLSWLVQPGKAPTLIPHNPELVFRSATLTQEMRIDVVDALLVELATELSSHCELNPPITILSYDRTDYLKCKRREDVRYILLDPDTLEEI